jgi:hypothetical protein
LVGRKKPCGGPTLSSEVAFGSIASVLAPAPYFRSAQSTDTATSRFSSGRNAPVLGRGVFSRSISRQRQRRFCLDGPPRLDPRYPASLKFEDDLVGDFVIEARSALAGTRANSTVRHRGSPRRAPRAFLAAINPSRKADRHSYSQWRRIGDERLRRCHCVLTAWTTGSRRQVYWRWPGIARPDS